jgi:DNA-binding response OmpR family regulator
MGYKVLIVDDEPDVTYTLSKQLAKEGYAVVTASDGEEALAKVKSDDPDILVLDLMLPKKNGYEVLKELRQNFKDKWRPVVIVSAREELESVQQCYGLEADHYLTKPCTIENLLKALRIMVSLIPAHKTPDEP